MKKLLMTLTVAGTLAFPAGLALAQDDTVEPTDTQTVVEPMRERARQHQEDGQGSCDGTAEMLRTRAHDQAYLADGAQLQDGSCSADCTGDQLRLRDGEGSGPEFGGSAAMQRQGAGNGRNG